MLGGWLLVLDLLSVHLVRDISGNTMIYYHLSLPLPTTTAKDLHRRVLLPGKSFFYQLLHSEMTFTPERSKCPLAQGVPADVRSDICATDFSLACFVCLGRIFGKLVCSYIYPRLSASTVFTETDLLTLSFGQDAKAIKTSHIDLMKEVRAIRAHLLHYTSLLQRFTETVEFIRDTENLKSVKKERNLTRRIMKRECHMLVNEIRRLELSKSMQDGRLKNVLHLVCSLHCFE